MRTETQFRNTKHQHQSHKKKNKTISLLRSHLLTKRSPLSSKCLCTMTEFAVCKLLISVGGYCKTQNLQIEVLANIACSDTCILCLSLATAEHRIAKGRSPTGTAVPRHRSSQLTATHYLGLLLFTTHCFGCSRQLPNAVTKNRHNSCDLGRDGRPM